MLDFNTSLVSCKKTSSLGVQPMELVLRLLLTVVSGSWILSSYFYDPHSLLAEIMFSVMSVRGSNVR